MRDHFNPRARWKAAIAGARALHRFGSQGSRASTSSKSSGGWRTHSGDTDDDDDDDDEEPQLDPESVPGGAVGQADLPGKNDFVKVTPPEENTPRPKESPLPDDHANGFATADECPSPAPPHADVTTPADKSSAHDLKHEKEHHQPLEQKVPTELHEVHKESQQRTAQAQNGNGHRRSHSHDTDEEYMNMPGSFHIKSNGHDDHGAHHGWDALLRKLHIK